MLSRLTPSMAAAATSSVRRCCVSMAPRLITSATRYVSHDKPLQDVPMASVTSQRRTKHTSKPLYGVPLEQVTTSADDDSELTLGEEVKRHYRQPTSSFIDIKISDVLRSKAKYGNILLSIGESESVAKALQEMNHLHVGAMIVTADDDPKTIVGIFSTRDIVKCVEDGALSTVDAKKLPVSEVMSRDPVFAYSDTTALQAMQMMNEGGFRHLPVRDRGSTRTIGLISIGDLVRTVMSEHEKKNEFLEDLVSGKYPA